MLLAAWDGDCSGTQERMSALVRRRLAETQDRLADLTALAAQLQTAVARLDAPARDGRCDAGCACEAARRMTARSCALAPRRTEPGREELDGADGAMPGGVTLVGVELRAEEPIACSLEAGAVRGRLDDWQAVLARSTGRRQVPGGVEIEFRLTGRPGSEPPAGAGPAAGPATAQEAAAESVPEAAAELAAELGRLAAAEVDCCRFFEFAALVSADLVRLRVTGPPGAADAISAVFG